ncbi:MAG: Mur ligase [Micavibrio sp.]|nr:Mur ligase [Micavibrio sp.]|tara:strand:+ start:499 stop:2091 length:1593 start_codon:yes stop_codon:yes gene_type:complete
MQPEIFISALVIVAYAGFLTKRLLTYLHAFQQEEYDSARFIKWMLLNKVIDKRLTVILLALGVMWFFLGEFRFLISLLVFIAFTVISYVEKNPRKESKKKLAMTARAKRIYTIALLAGLLPAGFVLFVHLPWIWIALVQFAPFTLVIANGLLKPYEELTQKKYWNEAYKKLRDLSPTVIGITGSYGKTSVKHVLGHILGNHAPTLMTPGSVNTPMGITRIIREQLDETHRYFIAEMGAYGPGSIQRLCKLCPPDIGVITAIGHAHYERFKSLETVAEAKFELAQAALQREGKVITHEKVLRFPYTEKFSDDHADSFIIAGSTPEYALVVENAQQTLHGIEINIKWKEQAYTLEAPLYGLHHADNIILAFLTACELGLAPEDIINALKTTPQIQHRLEVKKMGKTVLIDDAYNSNPLGFRSALDLLFQLGNKKRKILITPGMVELGAAHDDVHKQIGIVAAQSCDIAIVIQANRIRSFVHGFNENKRADQTLYEMETFAQAQEWVQDNKQDNDVILIENDLPDVYERLPKL